MKKHIKNFLMIVLVIAGMFSSNVFAKEIEVLLDGQKLKFDNPPILEEGRTLVPFRKIFEALDYEVEWNDKTRTVIANKSDKRIKLVLDNKEMIVNEEKVSLDVAPKIIGSRTYVPIRVVSEYSDCDVLWHSDTKTVLIYSKQEAYKDNVQDSYARLTTDGNYIYYSNYDGNTYRFTEDLKKEELPFKAGNAIMAYKNKIYARFKNNNYFHYESIDLKSNEREDISLHDIDGCIIYNNKIYYEYFPLPRNDKAKNSGIYVMDIDGKNKKQLCYSRYRLSGFYVTDEYIFSDEKMYSIKTGKETILTDKYVTATTVDDENYYMAINEYISEAEPITPKGILVYNYKTQKSKLYPFENEIGDIEVTDNSIFVTWKSKDKIPYVYFIARMTKKFEYPVEIYKGTHYLEANGEEWYGGVSCELDVIGNYAYYNHTSSSNIERVSTDGKEYTPLYNFWKYNINEENNTDKEFKYVISDLTDEIRNKSCRK